MNNRIKKRSNLRLRNGQESISSKELTSKSIYRSDVSYETESPLSQQMISQIFSTLFQKQEINLAPDTTLFLIQSFLFGSSDPLPSSQPFIFHRHKSSADQDH